MGLAAVRLQLRRVLKHYTNQACEVSPLYSFVFFLYDTVLLGFPETQPIGAQIRHSDLPWCCPTFVLPAKTVEFRADRISDRVFLSRLKRKGVLVRHISLCPWYSREHIRSFCMPGLFSCCLALRLLFYRLFSVTVSGPNSYSMLIFNM